MRPSRLVNEKAGQTHLNSPISQAAWVANPLVSAARPRVLLAAFRRKERGDKLA
jgi:hypothetical protein